MKRGRLVKNEKDNLGLIVFMTLLRLCCQKILRKSLITYPLIMKHNYRKQFRICLLMRVKEKARSNLEKIGAIYEYKD